MNRNGLTLLQLKPRNPKCDRGLREQQPKKGVGPMNEEIKKHIYPLTIKEQYLDYFGHVNHAAYLTLFEEARWDWISSRGFHLERIGEIGYGPVILEALVQYKRELKARQKIWIESHVREQERVISVIEQTMRDENQIYAVATLRAGIMDFKKRKLIPPPDEWKQALRI